MNLIGIGYRLAVTKLSLTQFLFTAATLLSLFLFSLNVQAERLKDIASIAGVRANHLVGYGLVVGLDGTGDKATQAPWTAQSFKSMLKQFGIAIPVGTKFDMKNVAAVAVHTNLPAFAKPGQAIDITVSSIGNSKSLRGGSLLITPLKGVDGEVYALAQGNLVVGGFGAGGSDGSRIQVNIPSVGRIPNGAMVERAAPSGFNVGDSLIFNLHESDFTTSRNVAERINTLLGPDIAVPLDGTSIQISAPTNSSQRVSYMSMLENLEVDMGESAAKVIINSRTGTIVVGQHVKVSPVAVTHGSLTVTITERPDVSQPNALGSGESVVVPRTEITVTQENNRMFAFKAGNTLEEIVRAVNQVGAAPGDLMAILEALKQAGALKAQLIVI